MPERISDTSWHFSAALALNNQSDYVDTGPQPRICDASSEDNIANVGEEKGKLGDFGRIWELLGVPSDVPPPVLSPSPVSSEEASSGSSAVALQPSFNLSSEQSEFGSALTAGDRNDRQWLGKNILEEITKEEDKTLRDSVEEITSGGDTSAPPPLETPSEWEQARSDAKKEKRRLKKEKRKADRQAAAQFSTGFATNDIQLVLPTPAKKQSAPVTVPNGQTRVTRSATRDIELAMPTPTKKETVSVTILKPPNRSTSPYRASTTTPATPIKKEFIPAATIKHPSRSISPYKASTSAAAAAAVRILSRKNADKAQVSDEDFSDAPKLSGKPSKQVRAKTDANPFTTPKASVSQFLQAPQTAPAKVILWSTSVQTRASRYNFDELLKVEEPASLREVSTPRPMGSPKRRAPPPANTDNAYEKLGFHTGPARQLYLLLDLVKYFSEDKAWLASPMQLSNNRTTPALGGLHVFVDASNILIGFYELMKRRLGRPVTARLEGFELSFDSLVLLMERRRPVTKRIFVGSAPELPAFETARQVGYETHVLEKVFKTRELTDRQKFFRQRTGAAATADEEKKWGEQGVDELLHLKMSDSILDGFGEPGTMVLATGDAAEAEYSDGFKKYVERALKTGWKVELVSWSKNISGEYRKSAFQQKWADSFKIIELDPWLDLLLDA